jgi:Uma2 family endonuclease
MLKPAPQKVLFTVDDLEKMIDAGIFDNKPGRIELIEGEFRKMSPARDQHDSLIRVLTMWSAKAQNEELFEIGVQMGIRLNKTESMPEPDLFWIKTGHTSRPTADVVPLIIEVSVSTIDFDRGRKLRIYALDGIREYWIVDAKNRRIEVRAQPSGDDFSKFEVFDRTRSISPLCLPSAKLDVDWLFRSAGL